MANDLDLFEELVNDIYLSDFGPRLVVLNWDTEFKKDMAIGKGFIIKTKKSFDSKNNKNKDGIHSPAYGTTWQDENAFKERYSCDCKKTIGRVYEGETCQYCGTKVDFVDIALDIFGWISIEKRYRLMNPVLFRMVEKYIGAKNLKDIIDFTKDPDINGHYSKESPNPKNKYFSLGMIGFVENFIEIIEHFKTKRKKKDKLYNEIIQKYDCLFVSKIPVYSSVLRPVFSSPSEYDYTDAEKQYNVLIGCVNILNDQDNKVEDDNIKSINFSLFEAQQKINKIFDIIFKMLDKKEG